MKDPVLVRVRRKAASLREFANVRGVLFFAQRRLRSATARRRVTSVVAGFLPATIHSRQQTQEAASDLERQGYVMLDGLLTPSMVADMRAHFAQKRVRGGYVPNAPLVSIDDPDRPDTHIFPVDESDVVTCPHLLDVANHPRVLAAVEGVFGCKPTIGYMAAWWSVPTRDGVARHAENFHRDYDDINFIKLFIYLSDVDAESGPHEFIRGSHEAPELRRIRRYTDEEVLQTFGAERVVRFTGGKGTAFLENTMGLHRGLPVRTGKRLILQVVYSMLPMAFGPAKPYRRDLFQPAARPIDPYVNRVYVASA